MSIRNYLKNSRVINIFRIGKFIIELSNNYDLIIHLKMPGRTLYVSHESKAIKHTHVVISFKSGDFDLRFKDLRQFGYI